MKRLSGYLSTLFVGCAATGHSDLTPSKSAAPEVFDEWIAGWVDLSDEYHADAGAPPSTTYVETLE